MRKVISLVLCFTMLIALGMPVLAVESEKSITVESVLEDLENGNARETFEVCELSELTSDEINEDPALKLMFEDIRSKEDLGNSSVMRNTTDTIYGTYYVDTIEDSAGGVLKYYLCPRMYVVYGDIPKSGVNCWTSRLYVHEYITLNGEIQPDYINRIKLKNITGGIGAGPYAVFSDTIQVTKTVENSPSNYINVAGIVSAILSSKYATAAAITGALANIDFSSGVSGSQVEITGKNMVGVKFNSSTVIDDSDEMLKLACFLGTDDNATGTNLTCNYSFRWSFDVYKGFSKAYSSVLKKEGSVSASA